MSEYSIAIEKQMECQTLTIGEAAAALGVSSRHAYALAERGQLPGALKLGGRWVVVKRRLAEFIGIPTEDLR